MNCAGHRVLCLIGIGAIFLWPEEILAEEGGTASANKLPSLVLYVALGGNDAWTGKFAEPNGAHTDGPFATLDRARDELRARRRAGGIADGATVLVRAGEYQLAKAFQLNLEDSGRTSTAPVVYRAFPGEKPVLYGGDRITGFKPYKDHILQADVAPQGFKNVQFHQLYLDGQRQIPARYPNFDPARPRTGGWAFVDGAPGAKPEVKTMRDVLMHAGDNHAWEHPEDGEVCIFPHDNWGSGVISIAAYDPGKRTIKLAWDAPGEIQPLDRYYVRGLFEELDSPGEWFLDRRTGVLYFWPPKPIDNAVVRAPVAENVVLVNGAHDITIQGFTMECCEGSAIHLLHAKNCLVAANTIRNIGGRCDWTAGIHEDDGTNNRISGNDIYDIGNEGIQITGGDVKTLVPGGNSAENNYIHHVGLLNGGGCGIRVGGVGNRVAHNLIHDAARCGIFGSGNNHVIEFNRIRNVNLDTEDTGGIYLAGGEEGWMRRGNIVRFNFLTDILGFGRKDGKWVSPYYSNGIYLDDGICETTVYGNIVARAPHGGAFVHGGRDNVFENNIFIDGDITQVSFCGAKPPQTLEPGMHAAYQSYKDNEAYRNRYPKFSALNPDTDGPMGGNRFVRNIVCYRNPEANLYLVWNYLHDKNECDDNVIWHQGAPPFVFLDYLTQEKWENWQGQGSDHHSVIADPLFMDPEKDDYRLKPDSPAFPLGFRPIPVEKIGPYADPLRASWPIVEAPGEREKPFAE